MTGTLRTRSVPFIPTSRGSYKTSGYTPLGVMPPLESVTQDSHERNRRYVQHVSLPRRGGGNIRFPRPSECARSASSIGKRNAAFFSSSSFFPSRSLPRSLSSPRRGSLRLNLRKRPRSALRAYRGRVNPPD